jgi:hypothetical protein
MAKAVAVSQNETLKSQLRSNGVKIPYGNGRKISLWKYSRQYMASSDLDLDVFVDESEVHKIHFNSAGNLSWVEWIDGTITPAGGPSPQPVWLFPMAGFLIPWGLIRFLFWVVSGFFREDANAE